MICRAFLLLALSLLPLAGARAQPVTSLADVVATCGTPNSTYTAGTDRPVTIGTDGRGCLAGQVGGYDTRTNTTPTVQNAAYVSGNCVGGFNSVSIARVNGGSGILNAVKLTSVGGSTPSITVYLFDANPAGSTCTDKSTFTLNSADVDKLIAAPFPLTLSAPTGTTTTFAELTNMARMFIAGGSAASGVQTIYFGLVSGSSFTPASTTDIHVNLQALLD